jgi:hypothetical protein
MPENKEPDRPVPQEQELESTRSEKFFKVYANSAQIETSVWDFQLIFGELTKTAGKLVIEQSVAIVMSPQHAKAFVGVLANNIREYEKKVGEIKLPTTKEGTEEPIEKGEKPPAKN